MKNDNDIDEGNREEGQKNVEHIKKREKWLEAIEKQTLAKTSSSAKALDEDEEVILARKAATSTIYSKNFSSSPAPSKLDLLTTLEKVLGNILFEPSNKKFRALRSNNAIIKSKILDVRGGLDLLVAAGFKSTTRDLESVYVLDNGKENELDIVKAVLDIVKIAKDEMESSKQRKHSRGLKQREDSKEQKKELLQQLAGDKLERKLERMQ